jgi:hypothetical protein
MSPIHIFKNSRIILFFLGKLSKFAGILSRAVPQTITQSIGDRVVDVSVIPYMRAKTVLFTATDFKPDTILYPFFDNTSVEQYVARANKFILATNNLGYSTKTANTETI